ncbi:MAG TPA: hypothetical protein VGG30_04200 [Pirellulales bacterium]|jgi:hypothetical protein
MRSLSAHALWKRCLISMFILTNLATVLFVNLPSDWKEGFLDWAATTRSAEDVYRLQLASWRLERYAYFSGLDNRWQMFGHQSRFNWWYVIRGVYGDGTEQRLVLLPLPNQSGRTIWDALLFDLKETKFELNIYLNPTAREAYSRYIARQFPERDGMRIKSVRWELGCQMIVPPDEAIQRQELLYPQCSLLLLNEFAIGPQGEQVARIGDGS